MWMQVHSAMRFNEDADTQIALIIYELIKAQIIITPALSQFISHAEGWTWSNNIWVCALPLFSHASRVCICVCCACSQQLCFAPHLTSTMTIADITNDLWISLDFLMEGKHFFSPSLYGNGKIAWWNFSVLRKSIIV